MKRAWLVKKRKDKGFTHAELGEMLGVTRQAYSLIESGTRNPSLMVALKLSVTLDFDPILFLDNAYSVRKQEEAILK